MLYSAARGVDSDASSVRGKKVEAALIRAEQLRRMLPVTCADQPALQRQFDALDDHLDQSGFDARITSDQQHVTLHDCPYSEMVKDHPEVCGVHFRLIQGVLEQAEGPLRAHQLHLIEAPRLCTIDLHHASAQEIEADRVALEAAVAAANVVVDKMVANTSEAALGARR
jgi:predicted ArsR family transcriptional regulator